MGGQSDERARLRREIAGRMAEPAPAGWAHAVCATGVATVDGVDAVVLTIRTESRAQEMLGASDEWVTQLGQLQYTLGEGPGVEAFTSGTPVLAADLDQGGDRWPGFAQEARSAGVAAVFAFPMQWGGIRLGTLEFYRRRPGPLVPSERNKAAMLTELATVALLDHAYRVEESGGEWTAPVLSYQDVNMAIGMLAAQLHVSLDDAFARLRAHAYGTGRPLVDVARDIVARRLHLDQQVD